MENYTHTNISEKVHNKGSLHFKQGNEVLNNVVSICTQPHMLGPFATPVECCCTKFETRQLFQATIFNISFVPRSPKHSASMLDPFEQLLVRKHCHTGRSLFIFPKHFE